MELLWAWGPYLTIAVGLIGLGYGEQVLHKALHKARGFRIVDLACSSAAKAADAAKRLKIPHRSVNWRDLVDNPEVEAVVMAVPPKLQSLITRQALKRKKHLFCEKPLAVDEKNAAEMTRLARRAGVACAVDFEFPELEVWRLAKKWLGTRQFGALLDIEVRWIVETYAVKTDAPSWKTEVAQGGGALNNFVSHTFHYLEWFAGHIVKLNCRLTRAAHLRRVKGETGVQLWMVTKSGIPVTARVLTHAAGCSTHEILFHGSLGTLRLFNEGKDYASGFRLTFWARGSKNELVLGPTESGRGSGDVDGRIVPVSSIMSKWGKAIRTRATCVPGFNEGLRAQQLIAHARRSDKSERWVNCA